MTKRHARLVFEPLTDWPYPESQQEPSPFTARWSTVTDHLLREADHLGAQLVVVELDVARNRIRQDGQLHQQAATASNRVRVSMDTRHGPLQWHCDRFTAPGRAWQHNVRAIALTLQYLRRAEELGAVETGQQYVGFMAIEAAPEGFGTVDEALRWLARVTGLSAEETPLPTLYRAAAKRLHPDAGGDPVDWARLGQARQILEDQGVWQL
jgi:hypothetical protein